jgi:hypothetical protein
MHGLERRGTDPRGRGPADHDERADHPAGCRRGRLARSCAHGYLRRDDLETSGQPGCHARRAPPLPDGTPRSPLKVADRTAVNVMSSAPDGGSRRPRRHRPRNLPARLKSCGPDQRRPLRTMGPTTTSVEIPGSEVGDLVAEDFAKNCDRARGKLHGEANNTTIEMYATQ